MDSAGAEGAGGGGGVASWATHIETDTIRVANKDAANFDAARLKDRIRLRPDLKESNSMKNHDWAFRHCNNVPQRTLTGAVLLHYFTA